MPYNAEYSRAYREKNKEQLKEYHRRYRDEKKLILEEKELLNGNKEHPLTIRAMELNTPLGIEILLTPFFKELKEYKLEMRIPYSHVLCCSMSDLKKHIENQFEKGMNWKNIDIIRIEGESFQYVNLRPVWMQNK